jgi:hypothetical protein
MIDEELEESNAPAENNSMELESGEDFVGSSIFTAE